MTYFLNFLTKEWYGFSQQNIFIILIPEMISFMTCRRSSVAAAICFLKETNV